MPGCCLLSLAMFLGPRITLAAIWWLTDWYRAFDSQWMALLGWLLLPWTSLAWMAVHFHNEGRLEGVYAVAVLLAALADVSAFTGGARARRHAH